MLIKTTIDIFTKSYKYGNGQAICPAIIYSFYDDNSGYIIMENAFGYDTLETILQNDKIIKEDKIKYICMCFALVIELAHKLKLISFDFHFENVMINLNEENFYDIGY